MVPVKPVWTRSVTSPRPPARMPTYTVGGAPSDPHVGGVWKVMVPTRMTLAKVVDVWPRVALVVDVGCAEVEPGLSVDDVGAATPPVAFVVVGEVAEVVPVEQADRVSMNPIAVKASFNRNRARVSPKRTTPEAEQAI